MHIYMIYNSCINAWTLHRDSTYSYITVWKWCRFAHRYYMRGYPARNRSSMDHTSKRNVSCRPFQGHPYDIYHCITKAEIKISSKVTNELYTTTILFAIRQSFWPVSFEQSMALHVQNRRHLLSHYASIMIWHQYKTFTIIYWGVMKVINGW